jgi:hypothetical protein
VLGSVGIMSLMTGLKERRIVFGIFAVHLLIMVCFRVDKRKGQMTDFVSLCNCFEEGLRDCYGFYQ